MISLPLVNAPFVGRSMPTLLAGAGLAFGLTLFGAAPAARAEIVSLSATGFTRHCPCIEDGTQESNTHDGVLEMTGQNSTFYANVDFPSNGKVCSVSLIYRDVNGADAIRARLFRKSFSSGGNFFSAPTLMATATSASGTTATTRIAKTTSIASSTVSQTSGFYYVLVDGPTINLAFMGVQIDFRSTC